MIPPKDIKILKHLRNNARMSLTKMSRMTGIPVSTIFDRIRANEKEYISKHTTLVDFDKMGFKTRTNVCIKIEKQRREECQEYLSKNENINTLYRINNGYDFMFEVIFRNIKDFHDFFEKLEERFPILDSHFYYLIEDIKRENFMTNTDF